MRPMLEKCLLNWCILCHFFIVVFSLGLEQYRDEPVAFGKLKTDYYSEINITPYYLESGSQLLRNNSVSCEDLEGVGSFDTTCLLNSNLYIDSDLYVLGTGNLEILPQVSINCPIQGCIISFNLSGNVKVGQDARVLAGSVIFSALSLTLGHNSSINTTALGGEPPSQTSGTPVGYDGAGGGHGGRGASCLKTNDTNTWGGDVYAWSTLSKPWSYGSKGGGSSSEHKFGGSGGGRVYLDLKDLLYINGSIHADGGDGGSSGGGSGGSIFVHAQKLKGSGEITAAGGRGWGGGGGGRISLNCNSRQEDVKVTVHGGRSIGCPQNAGAAGTFYDAYVLSLRVDNDNITTETETPLLDFSTSPLWTNVYVENNAKVLVPLLWSRVQVRGQISLLYGSSIVFGLSNIPVSEFELVAEELLMSDSIIKVSGALRVSVKMLLMLQSEIQVDGGGNTVVTTSVLEVRNLAVLKGKSVISSNANLALYGQGLLKLTGDGDSIIGQRLSLSLFYNITVGPGSLLQAPLDDHRSRSKVTESLCDSTICPMDLITPPDDCHVNYTLSFSLQICRVEDIIVTGIIRGSIIHVHRARTVIVDYDGAITASELGCSKGVGMGNYSNGAGGGAGHGGRGGSGFFNGRLSEGGQRYGRADFPCELGSGSEGPGQSNGPVIGGGIIVLGSSQWPLLRLDVYGSMRADGQSCRTPSKNSNGTLAGGVGGGSGGTILLFLQFLGLSDNSAISVTMSSTAMDTQPPPPPPCWSNIVKQQPPPRPPPQITTTPATVTAAVAAETAAKVGNGVMVGSCKSTKGIAVAVVDANAIIQGGDKLNHSADRFVTVPEVLAEIRDRNSRHSLNLLPFTIDTTEPSPDSLKKVISFARSTGDLHTLSDVDLKLIALTYTLHAQFHGTQQLRDCPPAIHMINVKRLPEKDLPGWGANISNPEEWEAIEHALDEGADTTSRILPLKDLSLNVIPLDQQSGRDGSVVNGGDSHSENQMDFDDGFSKPQKYLPQKKEVKIDGKKMVADGIDASQGQYDDHGDDWLPAVSRSTHRRFLRRKARREMSETSSKVDDLQDATENTVDENLENCQCDDISMHQIPEENPEANAEDGNVSEVREGEEKLSTILSQMRLEEDSAKALQDDADVNISNEGPESNDANQDGKEFEEDEGEDFVCADVGAEYAEMSSQMDESVETSFVDDNSSEQSWMLKSLSESSVACVTADYAMQNVILQMGLRLVAPGGMQIRELHRWVLKCHACYKVTTDVTKIFCPNCGNGGTLRKVAVTVGENGIVIAARRPRISLRGTKFSLPLPQGGRGAVTKNPVLREDQLPQKYLYPKTKKKNKGDDNIFTPDTIFLNHTSKKAPLQPPVRKALAVFSGKRNPNDNHYSRAKH